MVKKAAQAIPNRLLRRARLERGWTQKDVADRIGSPLNVNINRWERGTAFPSTYYVAQSLANLAHLRSDQGQYEQAKALYQRALALYEQELGSGHSDTARVRMGYADLRRRMQETVEAAQREQLT